MAPSKRQKSQKGASVSRPSFDEAALSQLTTKIDKALTAKPGGNERAGKRKRQDDEEQPAKLSKKRQPKPVDESRDKAAVLLEEIKALGGDEGDLELVAGVDSDAEEGQLKADDKGIDSAFRSELAKFASGLGFEKAREDDAESEPPSEESESEPDEPEPEGPKDDVTPTAKSSAAVILKKEPQPLPEKSSDRRWAGKLMLEPRPDWHAVSLADLPGPSSDEVGKFGPAITGLKAYAQTLLEEDSAAYAAAIAKSSSHKFMSTIVSSGTLSDKVSALTLAAQESPAHNVKAFESLLTMSGKKSRGQALAALGALVDMLGNGVVLPSDRRLRPFHAQPGLLGALDKDSVLSWKQGQKLPGKVTKAHLIMWLFEDWLKSTYFKIIQLLEVWSGDEIEYSRSKSLDFIFGLLRDKPEQEANLMRLLVSKLGDRDGKIASRASHLLLQLVNTHPGMKSIVVQTVEHEVVLRPASTMRTKYHATNTLNQMILSSREPAVADNLIRIYFELFVALLKTGALGIFDHLGSAAGGEKKGQQDEKGQKRPRGKKDRHAAPEVSGTDQDVAQKLVSALLTGVNRAIPFAMTDESTLEKHIDTLFRITHSSNFNTSVQALILIQQLAASKQIAVDRFYRTLYESLLDPRLITSSKQTLYLNLLYKALKNDADVRRVKAFVKRMLQVVTLHQPPFACAILYLVAELQGTFPDMKSLLNDAEDNDDDDEEVYKDAVPDGEEAMSAAVNGDEEPKRNSRAYDGRKRNPEFSNAHHSCLWELIPYFSHYHPSVAVFANNLLVRQKSLPKPELANHTLIHFLDKFVYRNPKTTDAKRGSSIMQPSQTSGSKAGGKHQPTLNSESFWNLKSPEVAAEDVFFHEYFSQVGKAGQTSRAAKRREQKKAEGEDGDGSEDEEEIWQALVDSRPDIEGDDDDADMGFSSEGDSELAELLEDMSDTAEEEDDEEEGDEDELASPPSDGSVEFNDFSDSEEAEADTEEVLGGKAGKKAGAGPKSDLQKGRLRRKEIKALPMFASADDYAGMLAEDEDEDF